MSAPPNAASHNSLRTLVLRLWAVCAVLLLVAAVAVSHPAWQRQVPHLSGDRLSQLGLPATVALVDRQGVPVVPSPAAGADPEPFSPPPPRAPVRLVLPQADPKFQRFNVSEKNLVRGRPRKPNLCVPKSTSSLLLYRYIAA